MDWDSDVDDEDLIQREDMVVTVSHAGYIKRVPLSTYRAQRRGGKGRAGMATRDEDFVTRLFVANTHTPVIFFSSEGQAYKEKVWRLPLAAPNAKGKALVNMLPLEQGERITTIMPLPEDEASWDKLDVMFATSRGTVRRNKLSDFVQVNRGGKIAMKLDEGESHRRRADLHRERRRAAHHGQGPVHPLRGHGGARLQGTRFHGRARHQPGRGRRHHLHGDPAPHGGDAAKSAPPISRCAAPSRAKQTGADADASDGCGRTRRTSPSEALSQERYARDERATSNSS